MHKNTHTGNLIHYYIRVTPLFLIVTELLLVSDPITRPLSLVCHLHFTFYLVFFSFPLLSLFVFTFYKFFRLLLLLTPSFDLLPFFLSVSLFFLCPDFHPSIHLSSLSPALTDVLMSPFPSPWIIHHFFYSTIPIVSLGGKTSINKSRQGYLLLQSWQ